MRCHYYNITTLAVAANTHTQKVKIKGFHNTQSAMPWISGFKIPTAAASVVPYCFLFRENRAYALQMDYTHFTIRRARGEWGWDRWPFLFDKQKAIRNIFVCIFAFSICKHVCILSFSVVIVNFFTCFLMEMCNVCYEMKISNAQTAHGNNTEHVCN